MDENEMAMSGNTFVGNTKRDPNKQSLLLKSEQGTVVNRFKDSVEQNPMGASMNRAPSQGQVQTVIESYQQ